MTKTAESPGSGATRAFRQENTTRPYGGENLAPKQRRVYDGDAVAAALRGKRVGNRGWVYCCPAHSDTRPSGWMWRTGGLYCHAGCAPSDIAAALDALGFRATVVGQPVRLADVRQQRQVDIRKAQRLWNDEALSSDYDLKHVAWYLRELRGITLLPVPWCLRRWGLNSVIAAAQQGNEVVAVHIRDMRGQRRTHGYLGTAAVQLAPPSDGQLALAEGVEDALSVIQLTGIPCWATLGSKRLHRIRIPGGVHRVHLFADADAAGQTALALATKTYTSQGYNVRTHTPVGFKDFNDVLKAQVRS